jgi:hypothetical protein
VQEPRTETVLALTRHAALTFLVSVIAAGAAAAAQGRYHYAPVDASGTLALTASGEAAVSRFSSFRQVSCPPPRATHLLSYRHPCTGQCVRVPISFPEGTPRIEYRLDRVVYNYGSYTVQVQFLADGSVDVVYDSGLFRPL